MSSFNTKEDEPNSKKQKINLKEKQNILFVTIDQFRAELLSCAGHQIIKTPHLDKLSVEGVRFSNHYSQAAPCASGRACLYTGMYMMNTRVVANGTPMDSGFDNFALAARRAGYKPALFGYTDTGLDPRVPNATATRLPTYEGVLPGLDEVMYLPGELPTPWMDYLRSKGYENVVDSEVEYLNESKRPIEDSVTNFLTNSVISWLNEENQINNPWFAHVSYLRPHPPYNACGKFATMYKPEQCDKSILGAPKHWLHESLLQHPDTTAPAIDKLQELQSQYYGNISHVDSMLGEIFDSLKALNKWDDTIIIITSDHGDQLGDHGLMEKCGYFESSYKIPCIIRNPKDKIGHNTVVHKYTQSIDVFPTLCDFMNIKIPLQCDGYSLNPFLKAVMPIKWRDAAMYEWNWSHAYINKAPNSINFDEIFPWPVDRTLECAHLTVRRSENYGFVHFGDNSYLCYDLKNDPSWNTLTNDPVIVLNEMLSMLTWRSINNPQRHLSGIIIKQDGNIGRKLLK